jgi:hypothetical protein
VRAGGAGAGTGPSGLGDGNPDTLRIRAGRQAEQENAQSRVYLRVRFAFDRDSGMQLGRAVANYVAERGWIPPGR